MLLFQMAPSPQDTPILPHKSNFQVSISIRFKHPVHFNHNRPYRKDSHIAVTAERYKYDLYRQQVALSYRLTTHLVSVAPAASNRPSTSSNESFGLITCNARGKSLILATGELPE